ncbi:deoxyribodipyrimidine photo-lyase [Nannizzia gypsea CBS 118893]|uniref:Deoxyribodipyrimidine photo-lyase n=1 Tax=Arthroderma gypseum (strain ATCC MYA-4604 / CBS 118893) TaxID=535722 RepID=E4UVJ4_ARTGP|nr:deoxyribodipyrimidine photo-lyase [Nannizzia gypsea CBS 118893]EFR02321.1 deoxyribodipyrimidine photo-lyase [Nannizzia gypsea CBS 118893]
MPAKKRKGSEAFASEGSRQNSASSHTTSRSQSDLRQPHPNAQQTEDFGIILRDFYPPEISNARCHAYNEGILERPIEALQRAYRETAQQCKDIQPGRAVVHWFKQDLRLQDNRSLHRAYSLARSHNIPLICLYIFSPEDLTAHLCSRPRVDLMLRTLATLKSELAKKDIPLYMESQEKRKEIPSRIVELCKKWGAKHIFANLEYEVDELRREARLVRLCAEQAIKFATEDDTCVVDPGALATQQGKQYAVYTPWYRSWVAYLKQHPENLDLVDAPGANAGDARKDFKDLFDSDVPKAPDQMKLSETEQQRFRDMYPEGEHEAMQRLRKFLSEKGRQYHDKRDFMSSQSTSVLSPYFSCGALSARTAVRIAKDTNSNELAGKNAGYTTWISEVAWRDFYKHVLVHWPFICMNKCFKPEFTDLEWEYDLTQFDAWCEGRTGFPIVDAAMRQLKHCAWMHNRTRMIVSSFLSKDLLIDWRRGEQFFMLHLIDGDFASNNGGWGFGSSTGVDPQPYFRIFNPLRQSERFDPDGDYIRHWVPELRDVEGSAIHDPYGRGAQKIAEKNGYPKPIVNHSESRGKALERYKKAAHGA